MAWAIDSAVSGRLTDNRYPEMTRREELRQTILTKNQLFFHRWRPENSTYLFLFRKHEQGKNAAEIDQFDPLVTSEENKIASLKAAALAERKLP